MSSCSTTKSAQVGDHNHQNILPADANLLNSSGSPLKHKDDEEREEDVDFKPFLKETPSCEASSSLSSEIEVLDVDAADSEKDTCAASVTFSMSKPLDPVKDYGVGDSEHGEEIVMQTTVSYGGACEKGLENTYPFVMERKSVLISQPEKEMFHGEKNGSSGRTDVANDVVEPFGSSAHSNKLNMDIDDEDAICMRTRARYSLASFTLDELETFLQETDDDDDLQKVDDEEEYRKFLAAVLQGGDGYCEDIQESEIVDDEDEDNDADFEVEIEEALESDLDENTRDETLDQKYGEGDRRPKTRQNGRQKDSIKYKKNLMGQPNRPLRPLLPNVPTASFSFSYGKILMPKNALRGLPSSSNNGCVNGFSPHQIGQLHCLINEHVQLLIQVFSLCVLESARQHIASEARGLISEMLHKRDQVLEWRTVPYPAFCFYTPQIHPSVPDGLPKSLPAQCSIEPSSDAQRDLSCGSNMVPPSDITSPSKRRCGYFSMGQRAYFSTSEASFWIPYVNGPVLSVLDVAPLKLVGSYMDDVSAAVRDYQCRYLGAACDNRFEREPLFPLHSSHSFAEANDQGSGEIIPPASKMVPSLVSDQMPRKTMAAALVERAKKQSVALVPKEIAKLAERFFPLFNPSLYPHKPLPPPVVNRVLFTDAEDELLAMGLMEFNTDWKAIQQRYLPCKSKHQIFVRQKNRSSSKAPENPIKAVRRMKNSPLTEEERARIKEGLKVFKFDWMAVWKFVVPYRDPSLLPRQWRIATGTQKSYKMDADKKAKRRLSASRNRKSEPTALASWHTSSGKEGCSTDIARDDGCMNKEGEGDVHEPFLADWRPGSSTISLKHSDSNRGETNPTTCQLSGESSHVREQVNDSAAGVSKHQIGHEFPSALRSYNSQVRLQPYRARRANKERLVKLAPNLPPLNLPPSVRVMSQSAFKSYQGETFSKVSGSEACIGIPATEHIVPKLVCGGKPKTDYPTKAGKNRSTLLKQCATNLPLPDSGVLSNKPPLEKKDESGLQMHPLLFQAPEDGPLPYYPVDCSTSNPSSLIFFPENQPHLNLSLFRNPHQASHTINFFGESEKSKEAVASTAFGVDFHPLLQRTDKINCDSVAAQSAAQPSARCAPFQNPFDAVLAKSHINGSPIATCARLSSPNRKSNALDLEVHLTCTSSESKDEGRRDAAELNTLSTASVSVSETSEFQYTRNSLDQCSEYVPTSSAQERISKKLYLGAHALVKSSNERNETNVDRIGDQSLPEIVMEQEELSDSDNEIGENVEFDCEEMPDSEGEERSDSQGEERSDSEEHLPNKVEKIATDTDFKDQQCGASTHDISEGSKSKLRSRDPGKDNGWGSLCLDLNSCPPVSPPMKPDHEVCRHTRAYVGKPQGSSCSNNCCKKTNEGRKHGATRKHDVDMPQLLSVGCVAVGPLRKPRKRGGVGTDPSVSSSTSPTAKKRNLILNRIRTEENSNHDNNDEFGCL